MKQQKTNRPKATKRSRYKITNWPLYNQALKQRGSLHIWMPEELENQWYYQGETQRGAQYLYSDNCIEMACIVKEVYHLGYRQTQGFLESLVAFRGWKVKVPDYSVINRRHKRLHPEVKGTAGPDKYIVIDSTGAKVYGEGEWKVRQHGWSKHRTWRKIHLAVDESTGEIESCAMTTNSVDDAAMVGTLLDAVEGKVKKLATDGAYDRKKVYEQLKKRKIKAVIPPRKNARIKKHGNSRGVELPRDRTIRQIRKVGRKRWKKQVGYHRRSVAEYTMFRLKTQFGEKLACRDIEQQKVEVSIRCYVLNKMASIGMPVAIKVRAA
ncbi:MAG: IS5 family transposase [Williamsia sp.]|nr:IS5 family transposase [Williamsia sp.]